MAIIYSVLLNNNDSGKREIVIDYIKNGKHVIRREPYSEKALFKYKKKYEKQRADKNKIINYTEEKTRVKNLDINVETIANFIIEKQDVIFKIVTAGTIAILTGKAIFTIASDFKNLGSPIIPEEEIEEESRELTQEEIMEKYNALYERETGRTRK